MVAYWIVGSLDPDFLSPLAEALVLGRLVFAAPQPIPELTVFGALAQRGLDEYAVMLARDLGQCVAHRGKKILVGCHDRAVEIELDHGLRLADSIELCGRIGRARLLPPQHPRIPYPLGK
jgi:hypothetical protein